MKRQLGVSVFALLGLLAVVDAAQAQVLFVGGRRPPVTLYTPPGYGSGYYGSWPGNSYNTGFYPYSSGMVSNPAITNYQTQIPTTSLAYYYYDAPVGPAPKMRQVLLLRVDQNLKYREIALLLEVSIETVKAHLHQAKRLLTAKLGGTLPPAEERFFREDEP